MSVVGSLCRPQRDGYVIYDSVLIKNSRITNVPSRRPASARNAGVDPCIIVAEVEQHTYVLMLNNLGWIETYFMETLYETR
jgi:hypothetical protein